MGFNDTLRRMRMEKGYTQKVCAEKLGVELANYNKWENGVAPNFETLADIADFFDVSIDYLLERSPYRNYQEESEVRQSKSEDEDISSFGISIYRKFKSIADLIDKINAFRGSAQLDKYLLLETPFSHIDGIVLAYYNAVEGIGNGNDTEELIEQFLNSIREADKSAVYIRTLSRENRR